VAELTEWAVPIQEEHLKLVLESSRVLESSLALAAPEDPANRPDPR
jgi:hypothetical protein